MASRHTAWSADAGERVLRGLHEHDRLVLPALQALQAEFGYVHRYEASGALQPEVVTDGTLDFVAMPVERLAVDATPPDGSPRRSPFHQLHAMVVPVHQP